MRWLALALLAAIAGVDAASAAFRGLPTFGYYVARTSQHIDGPTPPFAKGHGVIHLTVTERLGKTVVEVSFTALAFDCKLNGQPPPGPVPPISAAGAQLAPVEANGSFALTQTAKTALLGPITFAVKGRFAGNRATGTLTYGGVRRGPLTCTRGATLSFVAPHYSVDPL